MRILWFLLFLSSFTQAQIVTDSSFGNRQTLSLTNQNYDIHQELGKTVGNNLFHSFEHFNIQQGEIATFSGANGIQNVISRVTGDNPSTINGTLRNTIPEANTYLMNPNGVMFGEDAKLDVQGSFHATTADYIEFAAGEKVYADAEQQSTFSVSNPENFGFLTDTPTAISVSDSSLQVLAIKTISLTAGDITLHNNQTPSYDEASKPTFSNQISAPSGEIILDAKGDVHLHNFGLSTDGDFGGQVTVQGQNLTMSDSRISSDTQGELDGRAIDIKVDNLQMTDSDIKAYTLGSGQGSDIHLQVKEDLVATREDRPIGIEFEAITQGSSRVMTIAKAEGDSGDIHVQADNVHLTQGASFFSTSFAAGKVGNIHLQVNNTLSAEDVFISENHGIGIHELFAGVQTIDYFDGTNRDSERNAIDIDAKHIRLDKGGSIELRTVNAKSGDVSIQADTIKVKGQSKTQGVPTAIGISVLGSGEGGTVDIQARQITLEQGGLITASTVASGSASQLQIKVTDKLVVSGVSERPVISANFSAPDTLQPTSINSSSATIEATGGQAGKIYIEAKDIVLEQGGIISNSTYGGGDAGDTIIVAETIDIYGEVIAEQVPNSSIVLPNSGIYNVALDYFSLPYMGQAGSIQITAQQINLNDAGVINASATSSSGGNIQIDAQKWLYLTDKSQISSSVKNGSGNSGNITIEKPQFIILNKGQVFAQADTGQGGNIRLAADNLLQSVDSYVSASSRLGIDGNVDITSPDETFNDALLVLNKDFLTEVTVRDSCETVLSKLLANTNQRLPDSKTNGYRIRDAYTQSWLPSYFVVDLEPEGLRNMDNSLD